MILCSRCGMIATPPMWTTYGVFCSLFCAARTLAYLNDHDDTWRSQVAWEVGHDAR